MKALVCHVVGIAFVGVGCWQSVIGNTIHALLCLIASGVLYCMGKLESMGEHE